LTGVARAVLAVTSLLQGDCPENVHKNYCCLK
jgi:hypothetical protein